jgi:hypothetical protein
MKRFLVFLLLAALLAAEIYFSQPWWWVWFLRPVLSTAWRGVMLLPQQAQLMLACTVSLIAFAVWFVKKWGLHVLLATAVLAMVPGVGLWLALELSLGGALLAIVLQAAYLVRQKFRQKNNIVLMRRRAY